MGSAYSPYTYGAYRPYAYTRYGYRYGKRSADAEAEADPALVYTTSAVHTTPVHSVVSYSSPLVSALTPAATVKTVHNPVAYTVPAVHTPAATLKTVHTPVTYTVPAVHQPVVKTVNHGVVR